MGSFTVFIILMHYQKLMDKDKEQAVRLITDDNDTEELASSLAKTKYFFPLTVSNAMKMRIGARNVIVTMAD